MVGNRVVISILSPDTEAERQLRCLELGQDYPAQPVLRVQAIIQIILSYRTGVRLGRTG